MDDRAQHFNSGMGWDAIVEVRHKVSFHNDYSGAIMQIEPQEQSQRVEASQGHLTVVKDVYLPKFVASSLQVRGDLVVDS